MVFVLRLRTNVNYQKPVNILGFIMMIKVFEVGHMCKDKHGLY